MSAPPVPPDRAGALAEVLRQETSGGKLLVVATVAALLWANLAGDSYDAVWTADAAVGPGWLHLHLTLGAWVQDGLLAVFFFVAGLEVKRELVVGELADRRAAALPFFAALGGMVVPALVALAASGGDAAHGGAWAIPVATDIAFALGVLALAASALPSGVRVLLLSMAVIDDLGAIALIAVLFTAQLSLPWLLGGLALCLAYGAAQRARLRAPALLWAIALAAWVAVHASGVHATVTGILLGLLTPVRARGGEATSVAERLEHRLHPFSAGVAVPVFALAAAGIPLGALGDVPGDPVARAVVAGLLVGKVAGILGGIALAVRLRLGALPAGVRWADLVGVALLGGIGYTVSLLVCQLALADPRARDAASAAVLCGSVLAATAALAVLRRPGARRRDGV